MTYKQKFVYCLCKGLKSSLRFICLQIKSISFLYVLSYCRVALLCHLVITEYKCQMDCLKSKNAHNGTPLDEKQTKKS